jgi:hypothetical protein
VQVFKDNFFLENKIQVLDGRIQNGMIIKIFYDDVSWLEYTISPPFEDNHNTTNSQGNSYGFVLPINNISLKLRSNGGNVINGMDFRPGHDAVDFGNGTLPGSPYHLGMRGTNIRAVRDGTVLTKGYQAFNYSTNRAGLGYYVIIRHSNTVSTLYAHMERTFPLANGTEINTGYVVGTVGDTGCEGLSGSNVHLHFEVIEGNATTTNIWNLQRVNPLQVAYLGTATLPAPTFNTAQFRHNNEVFGTAPVQGGSFHVPSNRPSMSNQWFVGWVRSGATRQPGSFVAAGNASTALVYTPQWRARSTNEVWVQYGTNGNNTGGTVPNPHAVITTSGTRQFQAPGPGSLVSGNRTFRGWRRESTGTLYLPGATVTLVNGSSGTFTLTAEWNN